MGSYRFEHASGNVRATIQSEEFSVDFVLLDIWYSDIVYR